MCAIPNHFWPLPLVPFKVSLSLNRVSIKYTIGERAKSVVLVIKKERKNAAQVGGRSHCRFPSPMCCYFSLSHRWGRRSLQVLQLECYLWWHLPSWCSPNGMSLSQSQPSPLELLFYTFLFCYYVLCFFFFL